ncbi:MAG: TRAP transporter small permease [Aquamicrobium sp.]|uniref:TRAP transporter small permease n=1 Tax=Aquamicrobium sp. TaxID=1872579 RepID=UPI00349E9CEF|nr:TRAP transporter small permease [Aquamicrobium sp.]
MNKLNDCLNAIYTVFVYLAALALIAMLCTILLQVAGALFGFHIPGLESYAVYCLAASMFLALASTMNRGEHIRVTLLLERLSPGAGRKLDIAAHLVGTALVGWMAWAMTRLVLYSYQYNDISLELDATPLWIPQSVVMLGVWAFLLATVDRTVRLLFGVARTDGADELHAVE